MDFVGKTILVVGASGVFGSLTAQRLVEAGATVLATCSSNESAARIPDSVALKLLLDLREPQSIETLSNYLNGSHQLDGIVIASGIVGFGPAVQTTAADARTLMHINHLGPASLISILSENLERSAMPFVAAITGVVAEKVFAGMAAYTASKTAFSTWLSALRQEKKSYLVVDARPGHTETGLANRPLFGQAPKFAPGMDPEHVVDVFLSAIRHAKPILSSADF